MKKILLFALSLTLLASCQQKDTYVARVTDLRLVSVDPKNGYAGDLVTILGRNFSVDPLQNVGHIYADTTFVIAKGVDETDIHLQTSLAKVEHVFILRIDLTTPGLKMKVGMPYDIDSYVIGSRQTPSDMIEYVDKPGQRVVAVVNADFWDTSNGKIRGPIHISPLPTADTIICIRTALPS